MRKINTIEEFWEAIDEIRIEKELNWSDLVGGKVNLAASKKWNLTLMNILQIQKELDVDIINTLTYQLFEAEMKLSKDPETPKKMAQIHQWIQADNWMENEEAVQKVQELAMTII
ncbi:hypothetical protein DOK67_0000950 [Enterococcus sp. DIV0212c]|uniref:hypothetical protein n=1 Tax=Enterococcus sp. DIV0212c TaxID=2230867 RepID=UPI001A9A7E8F|nr:hypothetical protein [Enterococcus sp. DIV0212c]MBO1352649.1 hypothetical protein [Enterococcus sp. DIV0212c]